MFLPGQTVETLLPGQQDVRTSHGGTAWSGHDLHQGKEVRSRHCNLANRVTVKKPFTMAQR